MGEKIRSIGGKGSIDGKFKYPRGVAVDCDGNILVADNGNCRIQKFAFDGRFITLVNTEPGSGYHKRMLPNGIAFNSSNKKVYVTYFNRF